MNSTILDRFISDFRCLVKGQEIDLYESISSSFEFIAEQFIERDEQGIWYDGVINLNATHRKVQQIEFRGRMWVAKNQERQWLEDFYALVTDKEITKQGIYIKICVGDYSGEGSLCDLF
ncbi:MAG: hypothetical protein OEY19_00540 [Gammaproteobacteria bacterium]|nr:hypothetical protein [Gammaproteobacteria bacterium]MDH5630747.1 hypothetical protein [Gammaproteobacteria bacterium]